MSISCSPKVIHPRAPVMAAPEFGCWRVTQWALILEKHLSLQSVSTRVRRGVIQAGTEGRAQGRLVEQPKRDVAGKQNPLLPLFLPLCLGARCPVPSLGFYSCSITSKEVLNGRGPRGGSERRGGIVDEEPEKGSVLPAFPDPSLQRQEG